MLHRNNYEITPGVDSVTIVFFVSMKRSKEDPIPDGQSNQPKRVEMNANNWKEDVARFFLQSNGRHLICYDAERSVYYGVIESGTRRVQITSTQDLSVIVVADVGGLDITVSEIKGTSVREITVEEKGSIQLDGKGNRWEGNVKGGEPYGYGTMSNANGKTLFKGFMLNGMRVCYGIEYYPLMKRIAYMGGYYESKRHGYGVLYDIDGLVVYQGIWKRGSRYTPEAGVIDSQIAVIRIPNSSLSELGKIVLVQWLYSLKHIVIGNRCFRQVRFFELNGLNSLEAVTIGSNSFQVSKYERTDGCCRIMNCPNLGSIHFGDDSFYDYHSFEIQNLPSLKILLLGQYCFSYAPFFSLRGSRCVNRLTGRSSQSQLGEARSAGIHLLSLGCI